MTHDSQLLRLEHNNGGGDMTDMLQAPGTPRGVGPIAAKAQSPVARVRSIMHGRWKYAIPLAITCAAVGALLGFSSKKPMYRSYAQIMFSPMKLTPEGSIAMPGFQEYLQAQVTILHSRRVIDLALQDKIWTKGNDDAMVAEFSKKLAVDRLNAVINIEYLDENDETAFKAVKATVAAFRQLNIESDPEHTQQILNLLDNDRSTIQRDMAALTEQRKRVVADSAFTPDTLERYYNNKAEEITKIEQQMLGIKLDLAVLRAKVTNEGGSIPIELQTDEAPPTSATEPSATAPAVGEAATQPATTQPDATAGTTALALTPATKPAATPAQAAPKKPDPVITVDMIALHDEYMQALLNRLRDAKAHLAAMKLRYPEKNPAVIEAQQAVTAAQIAIDQYREEWLARNSNAGPSKTTVTSPRQEELRNLVVTYRQLLALQKSTRAAAQDLGDKVTQLHKLQDQLDDDKRRLDVASAKHEKLSNELALANRVDYLNEGQRDFGVFEDKRKSMAIAGGGLGALLGFGVIFLVGLLDQRVKTIADAKYTFRRSRRVLGILPTLPDNLGDPRQAAFAAHCVHHVRNLLQLSMSPDRGAVLAVTSASPGEGKTSLTLSLGLSFAAANSRTLLIDCDVVGGGLTARVNAIIRRKVGDVLKRQGRITEQQLTLAMALANQKNMKLGEALVQLGYLSAADVDEALAAQKDALVGLLDVLDGEPINTCIANAGSPNLFILPRGMAVASNSGQVSAKAIRRIIAEARAQYDVVLIDTGPVLGSLEASIVASEADGVVLAVSRGQQKTLAERAMELLDSIGANTAGIVFNRAQTDDMDTIQYSSSIPASALQSVPSQTASGIGSSRLGPIAYAVASATNQSTAHRSQGGADHVNGSGAPGTDAPAEPAAKKDGA